MNRNEFLVFTMNLFLKLMRMDTEIASDVAALENEEIDDVNAQVLINFEETAIQKLTRNTKLTEFFKAKFTPSTKIDTPYILNMVEAGAGNYSVAKLKEKLAANLSFKTAEHDYNYYYALSKMTITTGDTALIQSAINKINTLNSVN